MYSNGFRTHSHSYSMLRKWHTFIQLSGLINSCRDMYCTNSPLIISVFTFDTQWMELTSARMKCIVFLAQWRDAIWHNKKWNIQSNLSFIKCFFGSLDSKFPESRIALSVHLLFPFYSLQLERFKYSANTLPLFDFEVGTKRLI